jgi:hypothetical protein
MQTNAQTLIVKIQSLPPERLAEVEDFVEFLSAKTRRQDALDRLFSVAPALEAAGAEPVTEEQILAEVEAVRADRRTRRVEGGGADRI